MCFAKLITDSQLIYRVTPLKFVMFSFYFLCKNCVGGQHISNSRNHTVERIPLSAGSYVFYQKYFFCQRTFKHIFSEIFMFKNHSHAFKSINKSFFDVFNIFCFRICEYNFFISTYSFLAPLVLLFQALNIP